MKKSAISVTCFLLLISTESFCQQLDQDGTFLISTNPLKLIYGIVNFEFEYQVSPSLSVQLGAEYVLAHHVIKRETHPDFVFRTGPRYHAFHDEDFGERNDLYIGVFAGYFWSKQVEQLSAFNGGGEAGYKYKFEDPIFINSKVFITVPFDRQRIIPGLECLLGYATAF